METISDIVRLLRSSAHIQNADSPQSVLRLADRIEAAHKREVVAAATRAATCAVKRTEARVMRDSAINNAVKRREALEAVIKVGYPHNFQREAPHIRRYCYDITKAIEKCFTALAAPPRNCDVGTEQDQQDRFREFCRHYESEGECGIGRSQAACPAFQGGRNPDCSLWWAHMPYEEGGER